MSEFTKIGGYLIEGQPQVYTDANLTGAGLPDSPLGIGSNVVTSGELAAVSGEITALIPTAITGDYLTTADSGNFYTTANESGFITGIPDNLTLTALNVIGQIDPEQSELESVIITQTGISLGNELIGGEDISITAIRDWNSTYETVSANSATWNETTDTLSANSGSWGGSALPISAGKGVKISLQNNTLVFENDETVLWEGTATSANIDNIALSKNVTAFDRIGFYWEPFRLFGRDTSIDYTYTYTEVQNNPQNLYVLNQLCPQTNNNNKPLQVTLKLKTSGTNLSSYYGYYAAHNTWYPEDHVDYTILKVIGINRTVG